MKGVLKLLIPPFLENIRVAGAVARQAIAENFSSEVERHRLELAIVEAMTNVVKHGYAGAPHGHIELHVRRDGQFLEFNVIDDGMPFDPSTAAVRHLELGALETLPEGGMGLFLMRKALDDLSYTRKSGRNHLTMRKRIACGEGVDRLRQVLVVHQRETPAQTAREEQTMISPTPDALPVLPAKGNPDNQKQKGQPPDHVETPLDLEKLWDIAMYDEELLKELIRLFLADAPERISLLRHAIAKNEPRTVEVISHGLRGASQSMSAERLSKLFSTLEELGEAGSTDGAEELIGEVEMEFARLQDYLATVNLHAPGAANPQD